MIDFYSDENGSFIKEYLKQNPTELDKLEKTASVNEEWPPFSSLTKEAFADPINMKFPIFSKTAAHTSAIYAKAQADIVPLEVKERIQEACDIFEIDEDVLGYQKIASSNVELEDNDFIFPEQKKLPVVDKETWELSSDIFLKVAEELSFEDAVIGARRLIKKAHELNINMIPEELKRLSLKNVHISDEMLKKQSVELFLETGDSRFNEIAKTASANDNKIEAIRTMIEICRENNMDKTKTILSKIASVSKDDIITINGLNVHVDKIASIPEDEWKEVLPYEEIDYIFDDNGEFNKEAFEKIYNTLSDTEKDIIESFIQKRL